MNARVMGGNDVTKVAMPQATPTVCIVDDDDSVRVSVAELVRREGWKAEAPEASCSTSACPTCASSSCRAVKAHMKSITSKLGANDRTHAVTIALKRGILEL